MKTLIKNYSFNKTNKTITFSDYISINLENILLITNVTKNIIIYNFADVSIGGIVSNNLLTLNYDTSAMDDTDKIQIFYDQENTDFRILNQEVLTGIKEVVHSLQALKVNQGLPDSSGRVRVNMELGGTIGAVTSLSDIASIGSVLPKTFMVESMNIGAANIRSRIGVS